jgi:hypothetical protein
MLMAVLVRADMCSSSSSSTDSSSCSSGNNSSSRMTALGAPLTIVAGAGASDAESCQVSVNCCSHLTNDTHNVLQQAVQ